jgi:hypothetical protein
MVYDLVARLEARIEALEKRIEALLHRHEPHCSPTVGGAAHGAHIVYDELAQWIKGHNG